MITDYFLRVKEIFKTYDRIITDRSTLEKVYSDTKGFIQGELVFSDDSRLEFAEVKDTDMQPKIKYRYHYMDEVDGLVFRYDNARHYPKLSTFPHHKHTPKGVTACSEPDLDGVLSEIEIRVILRNIKLDP